MKNYRTLPIAGVALLLSLALAACGDDGPRAATVTQAPTTDQALAPTGGDQPEVVEVVAVDYRFENLPASLSAGTQLKLRNDAPSELHELVAFRLDDDETRSLDEILALSPDAMQATLGAPSTVILAPPGSEQIAVPVGDGRLSIPGRYAVLCMIPTGADADEYLAAAATSEGPPDVAGGPPHIVHGMYAEVTVE